MSAPNPQAFPRPVGYADKRYRENQEFMNESQAGMTLRDYFAAEALPIAAANEGDGSVADAAKRLGIEIKEYTSAKHWPMLVAMSSYSIADAMLAERSKQK